MQQAAQTLQGRWVLISGLLSGGAGSSHTLGNIRKLSLGSHLSRSLCSTVYWSSSVLFLRLAASPGTPLPHLQPVYSLLIVRQRTRSVCVSTCPKFPINMQSLPGWNSLDSSLLVPLPSVWVHAAPESWKRLSPPLQPAQHWLCFSGLSSSALWVSLSFVVAAWKEFYVPWNIEGRTRAFMICPMRKKLSHWMHSTSLVCW